jgi:hypothetical protein
VYEVIESSSLEKGEPESMDESSNQSWLRQIAAFMCRGLLLTIATTCAGSAIQQLLGIFNIWIAENLILKYWSN